MVEMKEIPALLAEGVTIRFGDEALPVLSNVSFRIEQGERVALIGLNGSGKSTLLAALVGLMPIEGGRIEVLGTPLEASSVEDIRQMVGFLFSVPDDQILFPRVIDDVAFTLIQRGFSPVAARLKAQEVLERLGVMDQASRPPDELSHGQRLRVALAGAIVADPPLLLLDEPSSGLDPVGRQSLIQTLLELPSTMLVATHDLGFAARTCTRYLMLENGAIVEEGQDFSAVDRRWGIVAEARQ
jgi:cobalt/nickel transport system ATP-binding protein